MPLILGVAGTPRRGGNSEVLLEALLAGASAAGAETRAVHLREAGVHPCLGCERCRKGGHCTRLLDGMQELYPMVEEARGLVLITPTHNYNVSALMKAFIDRLYCFYDFTPPRPGAWASRLAGQGRRAVIGAVAEQPGQSGLGVVLPALRLPLEALGYQVDEELVAPGIFSLAGVRKEPDLLEAARAAGERLARALGG